MLLMKEVCLFEIREVNGTTTIEKPPLNRNELGVKVYAQKNIATRHHELDTVL